MAMLPVLSPRPYTCIHVHDKINEPQLSLAVYVQCTTHYTITSLHLHVDACGSLILSCTCLACFFLSSFSSLIKNMYHVSMSTLQLSLAVYVQCCHHSTTHYTITSLHLHVDACGSLILSCTCLACFFLSSFSSLIKNMYIQVYYIR